MSSRPSRGAARLAAILDALPDALVLVNANGTVVNANAIALEAFEAPGTALVGRGLLDLLPEFDSRLIPGSMRRPVTVDEQGRTKPKRMIARRTDGSEFPVEVTSSNLEDSRQAYDERFGSHGGYGGYSGDEMLMIVVRDLSGTLNTEAELARSQRQTEMILRAAAEGVVGTDTDGRVVLVNPAAAQILGFRASDLGGQELHPLVLHSRADGEPFPYEDSPLADTLRSGRKHRVRGQVLWSKSGEKVSVDLTTAPVRDGDQLVGAVMTFTDRRPYDALLEKYEAAVARHTEELHTATEQREAELRDAAEQREEELRTAAELREEQLAAEQERYAALAEREKDRYEELAEREQTRYEALAARHSQLVAVLDRSLRGPLDELRRELAALASDDAGQLWPEANQVLHHLSAGYARMTTLVDNVLGYQRLEAGTEQLARTPVLLDAVVAAGVDGAVELIGPGRAQFAVHAPPIEVVVDAHRLATALAHLIADVAGIDATGNSRAGAGAYVDSTVVVAAAQRGEVVRIEVRGPYSGGDPVHEPVVRGIVEAHGGVLQTHEVPGTNGSAFVLEVPMGNVSGGGSSSGAAGSSTGSSVASSGSSPAPSGSSGSPAPSGSSGSTETAGSGASVPARGAGGSGDSDTTGGGRRRARRASVDSFLDSAASGETDAGAGGDGSGGTGRRRRRAVAEGPASAGPEAVAGAGGADSGPDGGVGAGAGAAAGDTSGGASGASGASGGTGRRRGRPSPAEGAVTTAAEHAAGAAALGEAVPPQGVPSQGGPAHGGHGSAEVAVASGRRARRGGEQQALALPSGTGQAARGPEAGGPEAGGPEAGGPFGADGGDAPRPGGRRARRALAAARERAAAEETTSGRVFALPPAEADREAGSGAAGGAEQVGVAGQAGVAPDAGQVGAGHGAVAPAGAAQVAAQAGAAQVGAAQVGAAQVGASVNVPAGVQAGLQARTRGGVPAQGGAPAHSAVPMPSGVSGPSGVPGPGGVPAVPAQGSAPEGAAQAQEDVAAAEHGAPAAGARGARVAGARRGAPSGAQRGVPVGAPARAPGVAPGAAPGAMPDTGAAGAPGAVNPTGTVNSPRQDAPGQHTAALHDPAEDHTPLEPHPGQSPMPYGPAAPYAQGVPHGPAPAPGTPAQGTPAQGAPAPGAPASGAPASGPAESGPAPVPQQQNPTGRRRARQTPPAEAATSTPAQGMPVQGMPVQDTPAQGAPQSGTPAGGTPAPSGAALPPERDPRARAAQPLPAEAAPVDPNSTQGRAISVRTLGQGVPFGRQAPADGSGRTRQEAQAPQNQPHVQGAPQPQQTQQTQQAPHAQPLPQPRPQPAQPDPAQTPAQPSPGGSGRRRRLSTPPEPATDDRQDAARRQAQPPAQPQAQQSATPQAGAQQTAAQQSRVQPQPRLSPTTEGTGRAYAIGAPDQDADEGPELLDGPGGAVEVSNRPQPQPMDDELPPEPLDNPRRLLVWPAPDVTTQQALSDRGYRPVIVHSREEVDAQIAAFPAALFVDPLTGPITRTALQSLRQAAVAAEVPVLVTAGLGQASREAAYGADPAVLLKALAPRDSEQHPPRVLLIEEHEEIALALTATLERRGMQVARADSDADAVTLAAQMRPNLVVMDLLQVRRRRAGIIDWLRANGQLNRTPLVVYTAAVDKTDLSKLAAGETVLFLAERSTSGEVQSRIVDLLAKIGTN
ncbi:PAS domain-containing protein [Streptomyces sp. NPDC017941]|uniref:PAS domain-containing protein n=1 Tax=Streptomyces sp. NPDC017941 TaxID=3365018 RepID=UPI003793E173